MKTKNYNQKENISRRSFLDKLWILLGTIAGVEFVTMAIDIFKNTGLKKNTMSKYIIAGRIDEFKLNSVTPIKNGRLYLSRLRDGGFLALSIKCTHLGCSIRWDESKEVFFCPCHSSAFDLKGNVQSPPASRALDYYPIKIENGIVKINVGKAIKREQSSKEQVTYVEEV